MCETETDSVSTALTDRVAEIACDMDTVALIEIDPVVDTLSVVVHVPLPLLVNDELRVGCSVTDCDRRSDIVAETVRRSVIERDRDCVGVELTDNCWVLLAVSVNESSDERDRLFVTLCIVGDLFLVSVTLSDMVSVIGGNDLVMVNVRLWVGDKVFTDVTLSVEVQDSDTDAACVGDSDNDGVGKRVWELDGA